MIAIAKTAACQSQATNDKFLIMLPLIRKLARAAFRETNPDQQEELVAETVANCFAAFNRLCRRGKEHMAFATPLAQYAIKQVLSGRRVGGAVSDRDLMSQNARVNHGVRIERLQRFDCAQGVWKEVLVEDKTAGPAQTAAARIDFGSWLRGLPRRDRRVAKALAEGGTTSEVAAKFGLSNGRISQIRSELRHSWLAMQGELAAA